MKQWENIRMMIFFFMQLPFNIMDKMEFPCRNDNIGSLLCHTWWRDYKIRSKPTASQQSTMRVSFDFLKILPVFLQNPTMHDLRKHRTAVAMLNSALKPPTGLGELTTPQFSFSSVFPFFPLSSFPVFLPLPEFLFTISLLACSWASQFRTT